MPSIRTLAAALATASVLCLGASPPALSREAPPPPAAPRPFHLPPLTEFTLPNGMKVTMAQHGNVPKVTIVATVRTGNIDEGQNVWLADITTGVMQKGAAGRDASQLAEAAAGMGGTLSLSTGLDATTAVIDVLSESASGAIDLVADLLQRPDFQPAELEKVRADMLRNLSVARSTAGSLAADAYLGTLYPGHPYGHAFPTPAQLSGYTLEQVKTFHAANFGAARAHIYVVGRFDPKHVRAAIEKAFGGWRAGPAPTALPVPADPGPKVVLIDRPGAPQSTVLIGKRVPRQGYDPDFRAASTLLGGYFSSRITRNIREDKGYTYSPGATLTQHVEGSRWTEDADITAESTGPAITEIYKELRRMQDAPPTAVEVQSVKNYMTGTFVLGLSSRDGLAASLANLDVLGLGPAYLAGYVGKVGALTPADFQSSTKRELAQDQLSVVIVGPLDSVRPQLEKVAEIAPMLPAK